MSKYTNISSFGLLLLTAVAGCGPAKLVREGLDQAALIIGDNPIAYEVFSVFLPLEPGGDFEVLDVLPTKDPGILAIQTVEWMPNSGYGGLRLVDAFSGVELSSQSLVRSFCGPPIPTDITKNGQYLGICPGGGFSDLGLVDAEGNTLWRFDGGGFEKAEGAAGTIDDGDLDGDGDLEFCVGFSGSIGCFDEGGNALWRTIDGDWRDQVQIVEWIEPGSAPRVVSVRSPHRFEGSNYLDIDNPKGELLATKPVDPAYSFHLVQWPHEEPLLLALEGTTVTFRDLNGEILFAYVVPEMLLNLEFETWVLNAAVLEAAEEKLLVVNVAAQLEFRDHALVGGQWAVRSALVIYREQGEIMHFEVLNRYVFLSSPVRDGRIFVPKGHDVLRMLPPS